MLEDALTRDKIQFQLFLMSGNRLIPVKLSSPNHNLVVPAQLGALDTSLARVIGGGDPGSGVVELVDQNVAPGE